jgi:hypothetical protein
MNDINLDNIYIKNHQHGDTFAILVSYGYGAGWSTWNGDPFLAVDRRIVEVILDRQNNISSWISEIIGRSVNIPSYKSQLYYFEKVAKCLGYSSPSTITDIASILKQEFQKLTENKIKNVINRDYSNIYFGGVGIGLCVEWYDIDYLYNGIGISDFDGYEKIEYCFHDSDIWIQISEDGSDQIDDY